MNDDTIYRQAAIDAVEEYFGDLPIVVHYDMLQLIKKLPSAERRGRWKDHSDEWDGGYYECSVCGEAYTFIEGTPKENLYNYCPNCGARMEASE